MSGSFQELCYQAEDRESKPAQANSSRDPVSKKTIIIKEAGGVAQGVGPEFKLRYHTHKKFV
jgi:hypothetical protein